MADQTKGLLLAGVGGQGVILASMIVADTLVRAGYDVKQSEVHGMAQRGGSVFSHIRWGERVASPLVPRASAEVLASFEWAEAMRWVDYVRPGGSVVADVRTIVPPGSCTDHRTWKRKYPGIDEELFTSRDLKTRLLDATQIAADLGNARAANSVILGSIASFIDVDDEHWVAAIESLVPAGTADVNLAAFESGKRATSAVVASRTGEEEKPPVTHRIDVNHGWCKVCDICSRVCPEYCLAIDGGALTVPRPDACTGCMLCEVLCPDFAITIHTDDARSETALVSEGATR